MIQNMIEEFFGMILRLELIGQFPYPILSDKDRKLPLLKRYKFEIKEKANEIT